MENSPDTDTLALSIEQKDGDRVLSMLTLEYPNLPNAVANAMHMQLVEVIKAKVQTWIEAKAKGIDPFGD